MTANQDKPEVTPEEKFAIKRESYFKKLAAVRDRVIARPIGWPTRPSITNEQRKIYNFAVCDILADRFRKILKEKKLNVDQFARELYEIGGDDYWFHPEFERNYYPDGTYDPVQRNRLEEFIEGELPLPPERELRVLECSLDFSPNQVLTNLHFEQDRILDFLVACRFLDEFYRKTRKFRRSKRVKAYEKRREDEEKQRQKALEEYQKQQAEEKKSRRENFISRLKGLALGQWDEPNEEDILEEI